jgi:hypothetical protein
VSDWVLHQDGGVLVQTQTITSHTSSYHSKLGPKVMEFLGIFPYVIVFLNTINVFYIVINEMNIEASCRKSILCLTLNKFGSYGVLHKGP